MICPPLLEKLSSHFGTPRKKTRNLYIGKLSNLVQAYQLSINQVRAVPSFRINPSEQDKKFVIY